MNRKAPTIAQWNINGFKSKMSHLQCLITKHQPDIIALQETKLPKEAKFHNKKYSIIRKDRDGDGGGVALLINNNNRYVPITLNTPLEAVAVTTYYLNNKITVCSLYLPPREVVTSDQLTDLINSLPKPFLILGDLNGKHPYWGSDQADRRGDLITETLDNNTLHILNNGNPTFHRPKHNNNYFSHLDLSICTPDIHHLLNWDTESDLYDSDHYPIIISHSMSNQQIEIPKRFNIKKTPWEEWQAYSDSVTLPTDFYNANEACREINEHILETANQYIHKTSGKLNSKYFNPWWNDECAQAIKNRNKALKKFNRFSTPSNLIEFYQARAKARLVVNTAKKESWKQFVSTINRFTPLNKIWNKIKRIDNKSCSKPKIVLNKDNQNITNPQDIVEIFGRQFQQISSNENYSPEFLQHKNTQERIKLNFNSLNHLNINDPFNIDEFENVLEPSENSTPGEDEIPYEFYKRIPINEKQKLLAFINFLWSSQSFPDQWRNAHIIPIHKPNKPPTLPSSYRPISLTITLCKLMEKMAKK